MPFLTDNFGQEAYSGYGADALPAGISDYIQGPLVDYFWSPQSDTFTPFTNRQQLLQSLSAGLGTLQFENLLGTGEQQNRLREMLLNQQPTQLQQLSQQQGETVTSENIDRQSLLDQLFSDELSRINAAGQATPEQQALINQVADQQIARGSSDIQAGLRDNLQILRNELAPSRGFRPEDTPIQDRGQQLAKESLRLTENLTSQARGQAAQSMLDYPLQRQALQSQQTQGLQNYALNQGQLGLALQDFQRQLQSENVQNQLAVESLGLNLAGIGPYNVGQFSPPGDRAGFEANEANIKSEEKAANRERNQKIATSIIAAMISSKDAKTDYANVDHQDTLDKIKNLDVERWKYKQGVADSGEHIGPYAEDFKREFGTSTDGSYIPLVDAAGVTMSGIKGLIDRIERLEAKRSA